MFHGLLPDSKIKGTVGKARHYAHGSRHGGRKPKGFLDIMVQYQKDVQRQKARKARYA